MATTKLTPIGGEYGVVIPKDILHELGIAPDMNLEVSAEDHYIVIAVAGWPRRPRWPKPDPERPEPPTPEPVIRLPKKQPW
jgi:antitoxin component of MazEF toxin-antitoxin module